MEIDLCRQVSLYIPTFLGFLYREFEGINTEDCRSCPNKEQSFNSSPSYFGSEFAAMESLMMNYPHKVTYLCSFASRILNRILVALDEA